MPWIRKCHDLILFLIVSPAVIALYFHSQLWYPTDHLKNRFCALCVAAIFTIYFTYRLYFSFFKCIFSSDCAQTILDVVDDGCAEVRDVLPRKGTRAARARIFEPGRPVSRADGRTNFTSLR